jgi:hypothetical protein
MTTTTAARWVTPVTWIAILAPLPYSVSRLLWAAGISAGLEDQQAAQLDTPGWASLYLLLLALLTEGTGIFVHAFVLHRRSWLPRWIPFAGGRRVNRLLVVAPLLVPIAILAFATIHTAPWFIGGFELPDTSTGLDQPWWPNWGVWMPALVFAVWGPALAAATFAYARGRAA